jgi:hypothetical protein
MIELDLVIKLKAIAGLAALVADRVYWLTAPPRLTKSHVVLTQVAGDEEASHDGAEGLSRMRLQVDCYADSFADACAMRKLIHRTLHGQTFSQGDTVVDSGLGLLSLDFVDDDFPSTRFRAMEDFELEYHTSS